MSRIRFKGQGNAPNLSPLRGSPRNVSRLGPAPAFVNASPGALDNTSGKPFVRPRARPEFSNPACVFSPVSFSPGSCSAASRCAVLALCQRRFLYPGAQGRPTRVAVPPGLAAITVATVDGETLHGLWRPPRPGLRRGRHLSRQRIPPGTTRGALRRGSVAGAGLGRPQRGLPGVSGLDRAPGRGRVDPRRLGGRGGRDGAGAGRADPAARPFARCRHRGGRRRTACLRSGSTWRRRSIR